MSATVTAIEGSTPSGGDTGAPRRRQRHARDCLRIAESDEHDGFSSLDLVNGLHGVCVAIDSQPPSSVQDHEEMNLMANLGAAAKVLASILQNRVETR